MISVYSEFETEDMCIQYVRQAGNESLGLRIFPLQLKASMVPHREDISDQNEAWMLDKFGPVPPGGEIEPLVQIHCEGDIRGEGFCGGLTMRDSSSTRQLQLQSQKLSTAGQLSTVSTRFRTGRELLLTHHLSFMHDRPYLLCRTEVENRGTEAVRLTSLSSFTLGCITPFDRADASGRLFLHRFASSWSAEGMHIRRSLEESGLEPSWSTHGIRNLRFGQIGSLPVRSFFPLLGIEDSEAGVFWALQLEAPSSWQLEAFRRSDYLQLSGGQADFEFGHWSKVLEPGESYQTRSAALTTVQGTLDEASSRLLQWQEEEQYPVPPFEAGLPVIYNEWCTSWGNPSEVALASMVPLLKSLGIAFCIIDAGWYADSQGNWADSQGDWDISPHRFPRGLSSLTSQFREAEITPGLWFECETAGIRSRISEKKEWLLHSNGRIIQAGSRRFLDYRNPEVRSYLAEKIIGLLASSGIGYVKIDYNETIGVGCDGADSLSQAMYEHIGAVQDFFREIREQIPGIVIENCASGGHRLEPSFISLTDMTSCTDAHETRSIPIIGANMQRLILPRKCQIWAVLHPHHNLQEMHYILSSTFFGRMCISGEIDKLAPHQLSLLKQGIDFYRSLVPLICRGKSVRYGEPVFRYRHPEGWQAVVRGNPEKTEAYLLVHTFAKAPRELEIPLPFSRFPEGHDSPWEVQGSFCPDDVTCSIDAGKVRLHNLKEWTGLCLLIHRKQGA